MRTRLLTLVTLTTAAIALLLSACVKPEAEPEGVEFLEISTVEVNVPGGGGEKKVEVKSNTSWRVISYEKWVTATPDNGSGNGSFTIKVEPNPDTERDLAKVTVSTTGISLEILVTRAAGAKMGPKLIYKNEEYNTVYIGDKLWMAENLRAIKYSDNSERHGAELTFSAGLKTAPYYAVTSNKNNWETSGIEIKLTDEQISKLGILYNWAAAVGITEGKDQATEFTDRRQGICPDDWHIPTKAEWMELLTQIEIKDGYGSDTAGDHLKTTTGWYDNTGTDSYMFAALPAGNAMGVKNYNIGTKAMFQSASAISTTAASMALINSNDPKLTCSGSASKSDALSVRCVKN